LAERGCTVGAGPRLRTLTAVIEHLGRSSAADVGPALTAIRLKNPLSEPARIRPRGLRSPTGALRQPRTRRTGSAAAAPASTASTRAATLRPPRRRCQKHTLTLAQNELGVKVELDPPWNTEPGSGKGFAPAHPLTDLNARLSQTPIIAGTIHYPTRPGFDDGQFSGYTELGR
jgi:hypothetical protein